MSKRVVQRSGESPGHSGRYKRMKPNSSPTARRRVAAEALSALGAHRSDRQRLSVQCPRSHHVAYVYDTDAGLVYWSVSGPHAHGSRDFVDTGHHGARGGLEYVDLLGASPMVGDDLPAWCDCGPHILSRADLVRRVVARQRTVRLTPTSTSEKWSGPKPKGVQP